MKYNPAIHHRHSIRLKGYDYSSAGAYFITAVLQHRMHLFGRVCENGMQLSEAGKIAHRCWEEIPLHFPHTALDEFIIMPDHMHGIIVILKDDDNQSHRGRGLINQTTTSCISNNQSATSDISTNQFPTEADWILMKNPKQTLGKIVRWYKARAAKMIRDSGEKGFQWQRNYYERIIRDERGFAAVRRYILNNPAKWLHDRENE